jgi:hypothetical protein
MSEADPPDRFATIAFVYSQTELAVLLSLLANEDIYVLPIARGHASVEWHLTVALGGIEIRVHAADAAAARALLAGIDRTPFRGRILFDNRLLDVAAVLLLFFTGLFLPPARIPAHFILESPARRRD